MGPAFAMSYCLVPGAHEWFARWEAHDGVLEFSPKGFHILGAIAVFGEKGSDERLDLFGWEADGAVDTIEDPTEDFFLELPCAFKFRLFGVYGVGAVVACPFWWWENGVDTMQKGYR